MKIEPKDMVTGQRYHVWDEDCCLHVYATGIFLGWDTKEYGDKEFPAANFDFGVVWGYHLHFEEVDK